MLCEGAGIDNLAPNVFRSEGLKLVRRDHEVGEGIEGEGAVMVPVDGGGVQRQGAQVGLASDRLGKVAADVSSLREVDGVPAHLGHDVLAEDDNLLGAELYPGGVGQELTLWHQLLQVLGQVTRQWRPGKDVGGSGISRAGHEHEGGLRRDLVVPGDDLPQHPQVLPQLLRVAWLPHTTKEVATQYEHAGRHRVISGEQFPQSVHNIDLVQPHVREEDEHGVRVVGLHLFQNCTLLQACLTRAPKEVDVSKVCPGG